MRKEDRQLGRHCKITPADKEQIKDKIGLARSLRHVSRIYQQRGQLRLPSRPMMEEVVDAEYTQVDDEEN